MNTNDINNENLYMMLKTFRDPVLANDGCTYERKLITDYISEQGTSPFTGQPLDINDLQSDNRLQILAEQARLAQPHENSEKIVICHGSIETSICNYPGEEDPLPQKNIEHIVIIIICLLFPLVCLILGGAVIGFAFYPSGIRKLYYTYILKNKFLRTSYIPLPYSLNIYRNIFIDV
jgi:hypothetical protein